MESLEKIYDECQEAKIEMVKSADVALAKAQGISKLPKVVLYEKGMPNVFQGMPRMPGILAQIPLRVLLNTLERISQSSFSNQDFCHP